MDFFRQLSARHQALKERIHNFRMPLSPMGIRLMKVCTSPSLSLAGTTLCRLP